MLKISSVQLKEVFNFLAPSLKSGAKGVYQKAVFIETDKQNNKIVFRASSEVDSTVTLVQGDYEIEKDVVICVDKFIQDIVNKLSGQVSFLIDKENLIVKVNGNKYSFGMLDSGKFPKRLEISNDLHLIDDKQKFFETFAISTFCTSENPQIPIYKTFDLKVSSVAATNEVMGVLLKRQYGNGNPPAKELNAILNAVKNANSEDELFYHFDNEYCIIKVSAKELDCEYVFSSVEGHLPDAFFRMVYKYTEEKTADLSFTIKRENLSEIIETANVFAVKAKQEGYPNYLTMMYNKDNTSIIHSLMTIPTVSEFEIKTPIENLETSIETFTIHFDPIDFKEFLNLGGDVTVKFFEKEPVFICTTSEYNDLIYFQTTVRLKKGS